MHNTKAAALSVIDSKKDLILDINDRIWEYAELSLLEHKSMELYCKALLDEGFVVEKGTAGVETAFTGTFGSGKPVIGILSEYDALSGLSQKGGSTVKEPIVAGKAGHGCGHNMLGAGAFAAALAVKRYLETSGSSGTVIFYGCPGEEGGAGKSFMARERIFEQLDAALTWHPGSVNEVTTGTCNSSLQIEYKFKGVSSHAAADPHLGRSALDAVELMNIGVQFLREHTTDDARIHYAITDAGGYSPNVVQPQAKVLYMVRSNKVGQALDLLDRVDDIAKGAALMTSTTLERTFIDGTSNTVPNFALEKLLHENFEELGVPSYTQEEVDFAAELIKTYENPKTLLPGFGSNHDAEIAAFVQEKIKGGKPLNDFLMPYFSSTMQRMGSTDVGDVSWLTPTAQISVVTYPSNCPGHSWQNVSCGPTSIAHKGTLYAGKVLAAAAIDLFEKPAVLEAARKEFALRSAEGYRCPIPADAVPIAIGDGSNG